MPKPLPNDRPLANPGNGEHRACLVHSGSCREILSPTVGISFRGIVAEEGVVFLDQSPNSYSYPSNGPATFCKLCALQARPLAICPLASIVTQLDKGSSQT